MAKDKRVLAKDKAIHKAKTNMWLYAGAIRLIRAFFFIVGGPVKWFGRENIPTDENFIMVAPHRTGNEIFYMGFGIMPKQFAFMAKKELFTNPLIGGWLRNVHGFAIDRENPGRDALAIPIDILKTSKLNLMMFPSGSRESEDLKGGVALIASMAKVKIVPAVYQGPLTIGALIGGLFNKKRRAHMAFGAPIDISDLGRIKKEQIEIVEERIAQAFKELDNTINPDYVYVPRDLHSKGKK
ncbi:MAG: 1-acyl-sn-glycerol-3-phosphate acyltransferase [Lactobacillales bacterium]|jgi:1-acyl-sn-glycerol-3-phosphate acyltransferase|nr:1-acyl-sn-glycerol-3-phosphate acyltransferase [Lactobacillales bacterium]